MNIYRKNGNLVEKYEIVSLQRNKLFQIRNKHGKFFSPELATLVDRILDGDYTVAAKILNLPDPTIFGIKVSVKKCFELSLVDNIIEEDYYKAVEFFNFNVPNGPVKNDPSVKLNMGFYYENVGDRLVKFGVKVDTERLTNIKVHILALCNREVRADLAYAIDKLIEGTYSVVPQIISIINGETLCGEACETRECQEYFGALRNAIKTEEIVSISGDEYYEWTEFLNIDCPKDFVPIAPVAHKEEEGEASANGASGGVGDPFAEDKDKNQEDAQALLNEKRVAYAREQLQLAEEASDQDMVQYWRNILDQIAPVEPVAQRAI